MYYGESTTRLDEKGRITLPAKMRQTMDVHKHSDWYMTRGYDHCIFLYPHPEWIKIADQLGQFSPMDPRALDFRRLLFGSVAEVSPDRQGRIPMPPYLRDHAGLDLKEEAVVVGVGEHIEIWSARRWRDFRESKDEEYKAMAERMCVDMVSGNNAEREQGAQAEEGVRT
ncbi:MAG: division/cell wall cluster transcriptional repressor MraZ [Candidatus Hydrogenedentota bacterium]